jgi:hypothetical protein
MIQLAAEVARKIPQCLGVSDEISLQAGAPCSALKSLRPRLWLVDASVTADSSATTSIALAWALLHASHFRAFSSTTALSNASYACLRLALITIEDLSSLALAAILRASYSVRAYQLLGSAHDGVGKIAAWLTERSSCAASFPPALATWPRTASVRAAVTRTASAPMRQPTGSTSSAPAPYKLDAPARFIKTEDLNLRPVLRPARGACQSPRLIRLPARYLLWHMRKARRPRPPLSPR